MTSTLTKPETFESEVLKSDKPVVVVLIFVNYGNYDDPSDDSLQFYNLSLEAFKSELQKAAGERYKIALVDQREASEIDLFIPIPPSYPPPLPFTVYEKGARGKTGFLPGYSKEDIFNSLRNQLNS